jgi:hypothetical protein
MPAYIHIKGFQPSAKATVQLLGKTGVLKWKRIGNDVRIKIPGGCINHPPCKYSWVFKFRMNNTN